MDPVVIVALVNAALVLLEKSAPAIQAAVAKGEISAEVQAEMDARVKALRPGGTAFAGPEWQTA
jgi:hypothetical protein